MVAIRLPPPGRDIEPIHYEVRASYPLIRIFDPTDHDQTPTGFRYYGPLRRFDHHRVFGSKAGDDPQRGMYYAARSLEGCLVEVFGDNGAGQVEPGEYQIAYVSLKRGLQLLDLRGKGEYNGAWRAGSVAALTSNADHGPSQVWSTYFYEHPELYSEIDGLMYSNAHNGDDAIALYERASTALICSPDEVIRLDDIDFRPLLQEASLKIGLVPPTA